MSVTRILHSDNKSSIRSWEH